MATLTACAEIGGRPQVGILEKRLWCPVVFFDECAAMAAIALVERRLADFLQTHCFNLFFGEPSFWERACHTPVTHGTENPYLQVCGLDADYGEEKSFVRIQPLFRTPYPMTIQIVEDTCIGVDAFADKLSCLGKRHRGGRRGNDVVGVIPSAIATHNHGAVTPFRPISTSLS
jgi:hypothetical protein